MAENATDCGCDDRGMERLLRRLLIGVGGVLVLLALVALVVAMVSGGGSSAQVSRTADDIPRWILVEHLPAAAVPGAKLFAVAGCTVCHSYAGSGTTTLHAPDLTAIGARGLGVRFQVAHLKCPSCVNPRSPMPPYTIGSRRLHQLAVFLEDSKGTQ
jgi:cbb3-type cytochrome oxidase cytochrome c subunit